MKASFFLFLALPFVVQSLTAQQGDRFEFIENDPAGCCFGLLVENIHTPQSPLDRIRIIAISPGVIIQGGASGPWDLGLEEATSIEFESGGQDLENGKMLEGFTLCFERLAGVGQNFRVVWETEFAGQVISSDTVDLECDPVQSSCDSIEVMPISIPGQPEGSCCFDITIKNRRDPALALNGLTLLPFNEGVEFTGTASGPWKLDQQSAGRVSFIARGDSLDPGMDLGGFRICVRRSDGLAGPVFFLWRTHSGQLIRCEGLAQVFCVPYEEEQSDDLIHLYLGSCAHRLGFRNVHVPRSSIDGFRISVITAGARIDSSFGVSGWRMSSRTPLSVQFRKDGTPVASGDSATGFRFHFRPPQTGSFQIAWCTLSANAEVTCDTLTFQCTPPIETRCDSLMIEADIQPCSYELGFVNLHEPVSDINDLHVTLQTPGATITASETPFEWFVADSSATHVVFRTVTSPVPTNGQLSGFHISVTQPATASSVRFEWCSSLNDSLLCCAEDSVRCESPDARGDSVSFSATQDYCSYAFRVSNLHVPQSDIDAFTVALGEAATLLLDAEGPEGWSIDTLGDGYVRFVTDAAGLAPGEEAGEFVLRLLPSWVDNRIPFTWCTESGGSTVACDTGSAACEPRIVQCDKVDAVASAERPCCFEFQLQNVHLPRSTVNGFNLEILTPEVAFFASTVEDADGWSHTSNSSRIVWRRPDGGLATGEVLEGLVVCFDNNAIGNGDFTVLWQSVQDGLVLCEDTLTIKCDRTLRVETRSGLVPTAFKLYQNYPNPFNSSTAIAFDVPHPTDLTLSLFDATGRLVMDLGSGHYLAGSYRIMLDASKLASGTYYYQLRSKEFLHSKPMLLLR